MERITIAELDINTEALIAEATEVSKKIAELRESQKDLRKENKQGTEEYVKQAAEIKRLSTIQRGQTNAIVALTNETGELVNVEERVNSLLETQISTNKEATASTRELTRIRDLLNSETEEGAQAIADINAKIDSNNAFLDKNSDKVGKNRRNVGNYKDSVKDALTELDLFNGGLEGSSGLFQAFTPILGKLGSEFKETFANIREGSEANEEYTKTQKAAAVANNLTSNSLKVLKLALISTGIGAILVLLGSFVTFLTKSQEGMDFLSKATTVFGAVLNALLKPVIAVGKALFDAFNDPKQAVDDLWKFIKTNILDRLSGVVTIFSGLKDVIKGAFELDGDAIKAGLETVKTGFKDTVDGIKELAEAAKSSVEDTVASIREAAKSGAELAQLRKENEKFEISILDVNAALEQEAQLLAGIADNATKSFAEREAAARRLADVEKERLDNNIEAARQREEIARRELQIAADQGQSTRELQRTQKEATEARIQAEGELTNFTRENEQRLSELKQDRLERDLDFELDLTDTRKRIALNFINDETRGFEQREAKVQETNDLINDSFLRQGEIIQQFTDKKLDLNAILAEDDAAKVLEQVRNLGLSEIIEGRLLEIIRDRSDALDELGTTQRDLEEQRVETQTKELEDQQAIVQAARELRETEFQARLEDLRNQGAEETALKLEQAQFEFEERTAQIEEQNLLRLEQLQLKLDNEKITTEEFDRLVAESNMQKNGEILRAEASAARKRKEISRDVATNQMQLFSDAFAQLADIAGKNSIAGKAASIAQATIDTFRGANLALATLPPPFGAIAAGATIANGLKTVGKIVSVNTGNEYDAVKSAASSNKKPKAEKGALFKIGGRRHSQGGTSFAGEDGTQFEAERGEVLGVMSRPAAAAFMAFNNLFSGKGSINTPYRYESGGVPSRGSGGSVSADDFADRVGNVIADRIEEMPNPVVGVEDIVTGLQNRTEVVDGANI